MQYTRKGIHYEHRDLVKQLPDTEIEIKLAEDGLSISEQGIVCVMKPYDEFAVEGALLIKEV
jgi:electron transfer flavoprotein alpha/beta subunit